MATVKKVKKKVKNGIHLMKNRRGEFHWNVTQSGRVLIDSGETYKNAKDAQKAMKTAHGILADFFILLNGKVFFDETGA